MDTRTLGAGRALPTWWALSIRAVAWPAGQRGKLALWAPHQRIVLLIDPTLPRIVWSAGPLAGSALLPGAVSVRGVSYICQ